MNPKKTSMTCAKKLSRKLKKPKPRGSKIVLSKPTPSMKNQLLLETFSSMLQSLSQIRVTDKFPS